MCRGCAEDAFVGNWYPQLSSELLLCILETVDGYNTDFQGPSLDRDLKRNAAQAKGTLYSGVGEGGERIPRPVVRCTSSALLVAIAC